MIKYKRLLEAGGIIVLEEFLTASVFSYNPIVPVDLVISRLLMNFIHQLARILYFSTGIIFQWFANFSVHLNQRRYLKQRF